MNSSVIFWLLMAQVAAWGILIVGVLAWRAFLDHIRAARLPADLVMEVPGRVGRWVTDHVLAVVVFAIVVLLPYETIAWAYAIQPFSLRVFYFAFGWIPVAGFLYAIGIFGRWCMELVIQYNYKWLLIGRYLLMRRIAWVSLLAVALCTTMVLVVISVMGGWLDKFKTSFRGLSGDIVIQDERGSMRGFPYYDEMIAAIEKDPACKIESAVPSIETAGLLNFGQGPVRVLVMGMQIDKFDTVNDFGSSLFRQHKIIEDELKATDLSPSERSDLEHQLNQPPSFDLLDEISTPLDQLPAGLAYAQPEEGRTPLPGTIAMPPTFPKALQGRLRYDQLRKNLLFKGPLPTAWKELLTALSSDPNYQKALNQLATKTPAAYYDPQNVGRFNGLIVGTGVIGISRDQTGKWHRAGQDEWERKIGLTLLDLSDSGSIDKVDILTRNFYIVDDSHLSVWQYDSNYVYVDFTLLQRDLGLDAQAKNIAGEDVVLPARATDIHMKVKKGINANDERQLIALRDQIQSHVHDIMKAQEQAHPLLPLDSEPKVKTWQETQRIWIDTVEHEKLLTVMLFAVMCVVAIFLIFCIFYMIVAEKTRDIGIIKSVGGTSTGVAGIFLGYGLVIGICGASMGLGISYLIVHNINEMHAWLGHHFGIIIWNPQAYLFDDIPNTMSTVDICWIVPIAVLASVLGALIPAVRAASMNPVESLRWE